jgi:hypothetical protein
MLTARRLPGAGSARRCQAMPTAGGSGGTSQVRQIGSRATPGRQPPRPSRSGTTARRIPRDSRQQQIDHQALAPHLRSPSSPGSVPGCGLSITQDCRRGVQTRSSPRGQRGSKHSHARGSRSASPTLHHGDPRGVPLLYRRYTNSFAATVVWHNTFHADRRTSALAGCPAASACSN